MSAPCAGCGRPDARNSIGGTLLCTVCRPVVLERLETARKDGRPADAAREARELFRAENSVGSYLLRDIPVDLWTQAKHVAVDRGLSLRDLVLAGLRSEVGKSRS